MTEKQLSWLEHEVIGQHENFLLAQHNTCMRKEKKIAQAVLTLPANTGATPQVLRAWFHRNGLSVEEWSTLRGFNTALVYAVIAGKRKCLRGESFRIAVALGLKEDPEARV